MVSTLTRYFGICGGVYSRVCRRVCVVSMAGCVVECVSIGRIRYLASYLSLTPVALLGRVHLFHHAEHVVVFPLGSTVRSKKETCRGDGKR